MTSYPTVYVETAFGQAPSGGPWFTLDDPTRGTLTTTNELGAGSGSLGFWTDLVTAEGIYQVNTKRGRQRLLQSTDAGTLTADIPNPTRRVDPTNTGGPYVSAGASLIKPMLPVRFRADWGYAYLDLPNNSAADYASTPHNTALAVTDLYFEWTGTAKWANSGTDTLAAKYGAAGNRSWRLRRVNQALEFTWSTDGTATTTSTMAYTAGGFWNNDAILSIYLYFDVVAGASGVWLLNVLISAGTDRPIDFQDNLSDAGGAGTSIFNATSTPITLGQHNASNPLKGRIYRFAMFDQLPGDSSFFTELGRYVAVFDARWIPTANGTVVSYPTNEVWTIQGAAVGNGTTQNYQLWQGFSDDWQVAWMDPGDSVTTLTATDGFKVLSRVDNAASGAIGAGEHTGTRIGRLLNAAAWPTGDRDIDTGQGTVQATTLAQNDLTELYLTTDTERGELYMSGDGKVTFRDRFARYTSSRGKQRSWLLGDADDDIEIPYSNLVIGTDDDLIVNQISIARVGGTAQTAADATSIASFLTRTFTRTDLIHQTDAVSASYAAITLAEFKDQDTRFDALTIESSSDDRVWPVILDARIGDRVTVRRRPPGGGSVIERDCFIEGIEHTVTPPTTWKTTFQLSDASRWGGFVLNDSVLGVLDTDALNF